jgi:DNA processing protein
MNEIKLKDKSYPANLKKITCPPEKLYVMGKILPKDHKAVAIVGTRKMTGYGQRMAQMFASQLVKNSFTIVSGLALGVDTVAHKTALKAGGRTIAVLGSGLDVIYPYQNKSLAKNIAKSGSNVSEFPPGTKPLGTHFLVRNRIISGLSLAVLVIEGARKSGTISTATWAANQGREVFAVPGPIDSPMSEAPNYLIEQGAHVATKTKDILDMIM